MASPSALWTIGHSTRPIGEFIDLLDAHDIRVLIDVRTIPRSRHNPQFNTEALAKSLRKKELAYRHMPQLGGLRRATKDSRNAGWRNERFRGYADYMQTKEFQKALEELMADGQSHRTAIMCAEAVPWRCHRSLIADALVVREWTVHHIMSKQAAHKHELTSFAVMDRGLLMYPEPTGSGEQRQLL